MPNDISAFFTSEVAKLKEMSFKEKISYIWEYYKYFIIGFVIVMVLIANIVNAILHPPKDNFAHLIFYGGYVDELVAEELKNELAAALMTEEERLTGDIYYTNILLASGDIQIDMANRQKFAAMIAAQELDILLINENELSANIEQGMCMPLGEVLGEDLSKYSDKLITSTFEGVEAPYAIKTQGNKFFERDGVYIENMCLAVIINTKNLEHVREIIDYLEGYYD
ncbi:MAG: hypothetical protein LBQ68_03260 [Clostridiales bacterium]|jgi:hypothetical protein|nr:hypothetical protein [Clostridiales bacterium]